MTICTLASSSSGNCTIVSHDDTHILIDAGISLKRIRDNLKNLGITPDDLTGVLITHEHSDHTNGLKMLSKYHEIPIFTSFGGADKIRSLTPEVKPFVNGFEIGTVFDLGGIAIRSFRTPHDAHESVGYRLSAGGKTFAYVTDLGCVTDDVLDGTMGADIAFIESNHDREMLKSGPYPSSLKRRVLSAYGHLSNVDCGQYAVQLVLSGTQTLQLSHLSCENNTPGTALRTVEKALMEGGFAVGHHVQLDVALPFTPSRMYVL